MTRPHLAEEAGLVEFLQWTEDQGGNISGNFQRVSAGHDAMETRTQSGMMTGIRNDESISITYHWDALTQTTFTGRITGDTLILTMPGEANTLQAIEYRRADIGNYNKAALSLSRTIADQAATTTAEYAKAQATASAIQAATATARAEQAARDRAIRGWEAAREYATAMLNEFHVVPREDWFTERDDGETAVVVRELQAQLDAIKDNVAQGDCYNFDYDIDNLHYYAKNLTWVRGNLDHSIRNLTDAVGQMHARRDSLGSEVPQYIIDETDRLTQLGKQRIDLVNEKYDQAQEIVQSITNEADALTCN